VLELLAPPHDPDSASGVARTLRLPRQKVNYHLRELEEAGLVEHVEDRRRGNCVERIVRATATTYLISPEALGALGATGAGAQDRFSWATLVGGAARAIRDLAVLRRRADGVGKALPTLSLETEIRFASPGAMNEFSEELAREVARLTSKYHDERAERGRVFRFFLGAYPTITKTEEDAAREQREAERSKNDGDED
jgi:DNA-binding transcriptional ArsR family regulator